MISQEQLAEIKTQADAINEVLIPNMPIDEFLQEAGDLIATITEDKDELQSVNIDWDRLLTLEACIEFLRDAETTWREKRKNIEDSREQWKIEYPNALELKKELLNTMRFVYDGQPENLSRVREIAEGNDRRDTIQDLHAIAYKAKLNLTPFEAINYDVSLFDEAEKYSNSLMLLLGKINGSHDDENDAKLTRDKAYTHLKLLVDYIRKYGRFVFRNNADRAEKYTSGYHKH